MAQKQKNIAPQCCHRLGPWPPTLHICYSVNRSEEAELLHEAHAAVQLDHVHLSGGSPACSPPPGSPACSPPPFRLSPGILAWQNLALSDVSRTEKVQDQCIHMTWVTHVHLLLSIWRWGLLAQSPAYTNDLFVHFHLPHVPCAYMHNLVNRQPRILHDIQEQQVEQLGQPCRPEPEEPYLGR